MLISAQMMEGEMFRSTMLALSLLAISIPCSAQDAKDVKVVKSRALELAVEQCVRENAPKVESAVADLSQATDFLVQKVCAVPLSAEGAQSTQGDPAAIALASRSLLDLRLAHQVSGAR